jgi:hypothetical protein
VVAELARVVPEVRVVAELAQAAPAPAADQVPVDQVELVAAQVGPGLVVLRAPLAVRKEQFPADGLPLRHYCAARRRLAALSALLAGKRVAQAVAHIQ